MGKAARCGVLNLCVEFWFVVSAPAGFAFRIAGASGARLKKLCGPEAPVEQGADELVVPSGNR